MLHISCNSYTKIKKYVMNLKQFILKEIIRLNMLQCSIESTEIICSKLDVRKPLYSNLKECHLKL